MKCNVCDKERKIRCTIIEKSRNKTVNICRSCLNKLDFFEFMKKEFMVEAAKA